MRTLRSMLKLCDKCQFLINYYKINTHFPGSGPLAIDSQEGPQCGLVALAMFMGNPTKAVVDKLLEEARNAGYSYRGEIFSAKDMCQLTLQNVPNKVTLYEDFLNSNEIKDCLLKGGFMLVPYDSDGNHAPCQRQGHKAHWALIVGAIETSSKVYVIARHGTSRNIAVWDLMELAESNSQLQELSFSRRLDEQPYMIPKGGIDGPNGLRNKAICIWPFMK